MSPPLPEADPGDSQRRGFAYLEHTADVRLRAWAPTYPGVVVQALLGMASLIHPPSGVFREKTRDAVIDAPDGISGLVQALNEVLYLLDTEGFLLSHATAACTGDPGPGGPGGAGPSPSPAPIRLTLKLEGDAVDAPGRTYKVAGGVKAATYGDSTLLFLRGEGLWQATITLDI